MVDIRYQGKKLRHRPSETVLDTLTRNGINVPFSCRSGVCYICLLRRLDGPVPAEVQVGLRESLQLLGYFLACRYEPTENMEISPPDDAHLFSPAVVHHKELLADDIYRIQLETATPLYYHAGQFINLRRDDGTTRSYSLASVPSIEKHLEVHVQRIPGGEVSNWIFDQLEPGTHLKVQGPQGHCYYAADDARQPLLLIGTGSGLAPLWGIVRDALRSGHDGPIHLYHGTRHVRGLYLTEDLRHLESAHANFHYHPCVSGETASDTRHGRAHDVAFSDHHDLHGWKLYLSGLPAMVYSARERAITSGIDPLDLYADPFESRPGSGYGGELTKEDRRQRYPEPDPELWEALGHGKLLTAILTEFYRRVYADPLLSHFFEGVHLSRAIEKQYNFLYQVFTGEKVYLGDSPRTAHHWMVISDELFDYREELMATVMREHDLPANLIRRWRAIQERWRADIVKAEPFPKFVDGQELPLGGFGEVTLDAGGVCDICSREIGIGTKVRYHLRLGTTYCAVCSEGAHE